jgi:hypothetical protein
MTSSFDGALPRRRALHAVSCTLAVYALAVLAHSGEFWPFSIYPMFARAGQPWTHALVIEVDRDGQRDWGPWRLNALPGAVYPALSAGVKAKDLSQVVRLTADWTEERIVQLRNLFGVPLSAGSTLMILRVDGRLSRAAEVEVEATGVILIAPDGNELNPQLRAAP